MLCVLRVGGDALDIDAILANANLKPARIDRKGEGKARTNALHYDVTTGDTESAAELFAKMRGFLQSHRTEIADLGNKPGVEHFTLDIAVMIADGMVSRELVLKDDLMSLAVELGLSCTISIYRQCHTFEPRERACHTS